MLPRINHVPSGYPPSTKHYLIYFITGNPGLIGYYTAFLGTLFSLLASTPDKAFHVFGQSLPGFEDVQDDDERNSESEEGKKRTAPYGLTEVIDNVYDTLTSQRIGVGQRKQEHFDAVILIGHSVGSYIILEVLRKLQAQRTQATPGASKMSVKAAILLFPTVTHIAQSPSGVKISTLFKIPDFPRRASVLVKGLLWPLPKNVLRWIVRVVTGMPHAAAEVTTRFLSSSRGVWQALHLARDEMQMITEDKWDDELWGVECDDPAVTSKRRFPRLVFYFGKNDHWVADHTRDALIAARGSIEEHKSGSAPKMVTDVDEIPHGFCIRHSEMVAEKVKVWIDEIIEADKER